MNYGEKVLETTATSAGKVYHSWVDRRPIPPSDAWFETAWASFRNGEIFDPKFMEE